jgi:fatty-acyl-CoA synthase
MAPVPPRRDTVTFEGPPLSSLPDLGSLTLGGFVREVAAAFADREALVFDDPLRGGATVRWTYAELLAQSDAVAAALVAAGIDPGDRVAVRMGNRPEAVAALFGIARAGAVAVPLSTFAGPSELDAMVAMAEPAVVLTQTALRGRPLPEPRADRVVAVGSTGWDGFLVEGGPVSPETLDARTDAVTPDDVGLILFSSGTSAQPKGMVHAHRAPVLQFHLQADLFRRRPDSRVWAPLPLFWTAGLTTALGPTLAAGGTFVLEEVFDAGEALRLMERERVTEPYVLPHQGAALAEHEDWERVDLSSLREVFGKSVFHRHPTVEGDPTWMPPAGYGMSETCASVIVHRWDTPREVIAASTGRLLPGMRLRIVDPDTGDPLEQGLTGELALAGPMLLLHYLGKTPEETFDADGFLRTGDVGFVDDDGRVHWTGRRSEMIKTAGANVAPAELELALRTCRDVRRCRVVGLPDDRLGEIVTLCVELVDGSTATGDDLKAFLAERVAGYKVPREVVVFGEDELPTIASGAKVRDAELIALAAARLGRA